MRSLRLRPPYPHQAELLKDTVGRTIKPRHATGFQYEQRPVRKAHSPVGAIIPIGLHRCLIPVVGNGRWMTVQRPCPCSIIS